MEQIHRSKILSYFVGQKLYHHESIIFLSIIHHLVEHKYYVDHVIHARLFYNHFLSLSLWSIREYLHMYSVLLAPLYVFYLHFACFIFFYRLCWNIHFNKMLLHFVKMAGKIYIYFYYSFIQFAIFIWGINFPLLSIFCLYLLYIAG